MQFQKCSEWFGTLFDCLGGVIQCLTVSVPSSFITFLCGCWNIMGGCYVVAKPFSVLSDCSTVKCF